MVANSIIV